MTVGELQDIVTASDSTQKAGGQFNGDPAVVALVERYRSRMSVQRPGAYQPTTTEPQHAQCGDENTAKGGIYPC